MHTTVILGLICALSVAVWAYFVMHDYFDAANRDIMQSSLTLAALVGLCLVGNLVVERLRNKK
jgi:hypothetical protein